MSGNTMDAGDKSSARIEREVEGTRARLAQNLEALRESVPPNHPMDRAMDHVRGSGGTEFAQNLGKSVRDNPLPVLLIGAGVGWLPLSGRKSSQSGTSGTYQGLPAPGTSYGRGAAAALVPQDTSYDVRHGTGTGRGGPSMTERAGSAAGGIGERVSDAAGRAYRSVAGAAGSVADGVGSVADDVGSAVRRVSGLGDDLSRHASRAGGSAQQGLDRLLREQPSVVGAMGVALGAALGALLPGTQAEDRLMGEASDSLTRQAEAAAREGFGRVQDVAGEQLDRAKDAAAGAYDSAKGQMDQSGLSPGKAPGFGAGARTARPPGRGSAGRHPRPGRRRSPSRATDRLCRRAGGGSRCEPRIEADRGSG